MKWKLARKRCTSAMAVALAVSVCTATTCTSFFFDEEYQVVEPVAARVDEFNVPPGMSV